MNNSKLVRGALLVALALALQSLRLVLPMPQLLSTFIIGTLVHMMLVLTLQLSGLKTALLLAFLLPLTAYVQGQVLLPFLIPVIWLVILSLCCLCVSLRTVVSCLYLYRHWRRPVLCCWQPGLR